MATHTRQVVQHQVLRALYMGGGQYDALQATEKLLPIEVMDPVGPDWPRAKIEVNLEGDREYAWNWRRLAGVDDIVAIVSDHPQVADRQGLFIGSVHDCDWAFSRGHRCMLTAAGWPFRMLRDLEYQVYGQWRKSSAGDQTHYTGLPTVFNAGGKGNYLPATESFTHASDPDAIYWRCLDAINYLLWRYNGPEKYLTNPIFTAAERLLSPVVQVDVEGLGLWAALARVAAAGGYDVCQRLTYDAQESIRVTGEILVTKWGSGAAVTLNHQAPSGDGTTVELDARATNVFAARVAEATSSCIARPVVLGGRDLFEITIPLQPAWDPAKLIIADENLLLPGDEPARETEEAWISMYWTGGKLHAEYPEVGRLWDANTDGFFSDEPYGLWEPDVADIAGELAGSWPKMPYEAHRLLTHLASTAYQAGGASWLEYTVDGGTNWQPMGGYRVLEGRLGVYLTTPNLASVLPADGDELEDNFLYMLAEHPGNVSLRLTCCVASPHRRIAIPPRLATCGTKFDASAVFDRGALGQGRWVASGSKFYTWSGGNDAYVPGPELASAAGAIRDMNSDRFIEAGLTIEWIDPVSFPLCGTVEKIGGIEVNLKTNAGPAVRKPRIVRRAFHLGPEQYSMELFLDTDRQSPVV